MPGSVCNKTLISDWLVMEAFCPDGNTDPNGLMWTRPPCGLDSCAEPGQVPAGYRRDLAGSLRRL